MSRRQEFSYKLETQYQRELSRKLILEEEKLTNDAEAGEKLPHVDGYHEVMVESQQHHLKNMEASSELLKLLNLYHGSTKGFSEGYSNF